MQSSRPSALRPPRRKNNGPAPLLSGLGRGGEKRPRSASFREPHYGRSGALAPAAYFSTAPSLGGLGPLAMSAGGAMPAGRPPAGGDALSRLVPGPFIVTPALLAGTTTSSLKRLDPRRHDQDPFRAARLDSTTADRHGSAGHDARYHSKQATLLFPTAYLRSLLRFRSLLDGVVAAPPDAPLGPLLKALEHAASSGPASATCSPTTAGGPLYANAGGPVQVPLAARSADFVSVELPLTITAEDLDDAEARLVEQRRAGGSVQERCSVRLVKTVQVAVLKDGKPAPDQPPLVAMELVGEKIYVREGPAARHHHHHHHHHTKAKYRFHVVPFPTTSVAAAAAAHRQRQQAGDHVQHPSAAAPTTVARTVLVVGRNPAVADLVAEHPSISQQHAALFWTVACTAAKAPPQDGAAPASVPAADPEQRSWFLELHVADLGSANGTTLNGTALPRTLCSTSEPLWTTSEANEKNPQPPPQRSAGSSSSLAAAVAAAAAAASVAQGSKAVPIGPKHLHVLSEATVVEGTTAATATFPQLPADTTFGPLAAASAALQNGDELRFGTSQRQYIVINDDEGIATAIEA